MSTMRNFVLFMTAGLTAAVSRQAKAGPYIHVEAVNDYSVCGGFTAQPNSITDAQQFYSTLVSQGPGYSLRQAYYDTSVYASDFSDPERSGNSLDHDYL